MTFRSHTRIATIKLIQGQFSSNYLAGAFNQINLFHGQILVSGYRDYCRIEYTAIHENVNKQRKEYGNKTRHGFSGERAR